jgi:CSLREA domain-containing protein
MKRARLLVVVAFGGAALAVFIAPRAATAPAAPPCNLVPQLRDLTINQGLGSYSPLAWGKDTLVRLFLSQPSCAPNGALIQITGATLTIAGGGGANRTISSPTPSLVSVFPSIATSTAAPAVDSTGDVKFDAPGASLSPPGTEAGFTATFTASLTYSAQPNAQTTPTTGTVIFTTRPGTSTAITAPVAKKTNALRVLVVPMGNPTLPYNTQLTAAGQAEIQRGMLTLSRIYPLRDGIAGLTDTSAAGAAAGLRFSIAPTLLDVSSLMSGGLFCGNSTNFTTLRALLAQFLQAFNSANPATPADRVLGVGDQVVTQGSGCDEGRAAVNGNEAWARLIYEVPGAPSRTGTLMAMELSHTMGAVPVGRNDGAFHSLYTNTDYLPGDLNRAYNIATRSVLAGTNDDHTVMRFVTPWNNTNTVLEKADWGLLLCRLGGPTTSDCASAGTVGSAAAGPAFVMSGTTSGAAGICATCVGSAAGTNVVESYFSNSAQTLADPASAYHLVQKRNGAPLAAPFGNQGVPVSSTDTHHDGTESETATGAGLFSVALPFDTSADRIELWKGAPGASGSLLLYARNTSAAPTVTDMSSGGPPVELRLRTQKAAPKKPRATRHVASEPRAARHVASASRAINGGATVYTVNSTADPGDGVCDEISCTLRDAILNANANAGANAIAFAIPGSGPQQIALSSELPTITDPVVIDGDTERTTGTEIPADSKAIVLNGDGAGASANGLVLAAGSGGSEIKGIAIRDFQCATECTAGFGLVVQSDRSTVDGNYVGLSADGVTAAANRGGGILLQGNGNTVGGTTAAARNVIAANGVAQVAVTGNTNTIEGNYVGAASDGTTEHNDVTGIVVQGGAQGNVIGGDKTVGNIILGRQGVEIRSDAGAANIVAGNNIGLDAAGAVHASALPGIHAVGSGAIIGDNVSPPGFANPDRGNVIVGSADAGIFMEGARSAKITGNFVGTNRSGASGMGNADGIRISGGGGNTIGPGNTFAWNTRYGVDVGSATNRVVANSIHDNGSLGIHNSSPFVAPPTLRRAVKSGTNTTVSGTFSGAPSTTFFIEFFRNAVCDGSGAGEGQTFIGFASPTTNGAGTASFSFSTTVLNVEDIVTATATSTSTLSTSEFSVCKTVVASTTPPGQQEFDVGGSDDNAQDDVLDLFLDCGPGKGKFPVVLALPPATATNTTASWSYNYDPSLACEGGQLRAVINDGFRQSGFTSTGTAPVATAQRDPFSAILSPGTGKTFLQYSAIPLKGLAFDPEDGALTPQWKLIRNSDSATVRTASGTTADLSPDANGWTPGSYTVELKATDSAGRTTTSTVDIAIVADADNDGIPASIEGGCLGGSDTDPTDAYADKDGDGIPNADDPDPCVAATAYNAVMTFQPNPFPIPSTGNTVNVTVRVPYRDLTQVRPGSVMITRINNEPVLNEPFSMAMSWKVTNNVGQALFDRQKLVKYFVDHNIHNQTVVFTISGSSDAPRWSFTGVATTFVAG